MTGNNFVVILGILFFFSKVCYSAKQRHVKFELGTVDTFIGDIGGNITILVSVEKMSVDDYLSISYGPPSLPGKILWKENETIAMPDGITVHPIDGTTLYKLTLDLPDNPAVLRNIAVTYTAFFIAEPTVKASINVIAIDPVICAVDGDTTVNRTYQFYEDVTTTCAAHYYGYWTPKPLFQWTVYNSDDLHEPYNQLQTMYTIGENGTYAVSAIESLIPGPRTFYEVPVGRVFSCDMSFNNKIVNTQQSAFKTFCGINYLVQSCKRSTRCVVSPFMNTAVQPGQSVTLITTFRKQAVDDWVVITYDPPGAPGTVIWQENDTSIVSPAWMSVQKSFNQTSMRGIYSLNIQMPPREQTSQLSLAAMSNLTVTYRAFMISYPVVVTKANITAVDLKCAVNMSPQQANDTFKTMSKVIVGETAALKCDVHYTGYKKPGLNWYNQSGSLIPQTGTHTSEFMLSGDVWLTAKGEDNGKTYQCKIKYVRTKRNLTPVYTETCNTSFTVMYATSCSIKGSRVKVPNEAIELTCTTNYDGVNVPTLDWYNKQGKNVTTSHTVTHGHIQQYKAVLSKRAGSVGSIEVMECRLRYQYVQPNSNTVAVEQNCRIVYSVKAPKVTSGSTRMTADFVYIVQIMFMALYTTGAISTS